MTNAWTAEYEAEMVEDAIDLFSQCQGFSDRADQLTAVKAALAAFNDLEPQQKQVIWGHLDIDSKKWVHEARQELTRHRLKTIIAGSRSITSLSAVEMAIERSGFLIGEVVCGMAKGIDLLGKAWAESNQIAVAKFPAHWDQHGKKAGMIRNQQMADYADALIAIWDGESPGTKGMIEIARKSGLQVYVYNTSMEAIG